jgi:hypothetical protein
MPELLNGTQVIKTKGKLTRRTLDGKIEMSDEKDVTLIPYALWNNRGPGQMRVWLPVRPESSRPLPAPTFAYLGRVSGNKVTRDINAVKDQIGPSNSNDHSVAYYHWWPDKDKWGYLQYDLDKPETISKAKVYWFDDGTDGGCRIPDEWEIQYKTGNTWKPVKARSEYKVSKNSYDSVDFESVRTSAVRLNVRLNREFSSGVYEWIIE